MCIKGGKQSQFRRFVFLTVLLGSAIAPSAGNAGSRAAQEKLAWMFTLSVKCPSVKMNFDALSSFVAREQIDFSEDSPEMLKIRAIGRHQQTKLKGMRKAKICTMAQEKFGPDGTEIKGLFR